jgi:hypothetical protein
MLLLYAVVLNLGAKARHCFTSCAYALPWQRSMPSGDWESRVVAGVFEFSCFGIAGRISLGKSLVSHETSREQNARIAVLQGKFFPKISLHGRQSGSSLAIFTTSYAHQQLTSQKKYPASDTPLNTP